MKTPRSRLAPLAASYGLALLLAASASAQVPEHTAVVGTFSSPASTGMCGLFLLPLAGGAVTPITGLPAALHQPGGIGGQQGVSSVALRSSDGALLVGTVSGVNGPGGGQIELWVLKLTGSAVSQAQQIWLGNATNTGGAIAQVLPDGRILVFAADGGGALTTGPMAGHALAIVDETTTPVTFTYPPSPTGSGLFGGGALGASGKVFYYLATTNPGSPAGVASLFGFDLVTGATCVITSWSGAVAKGLAVDDDGAVYVSLNDAATFVHSVATVHPDGCNPVVSSTTASASLLPTGSLGLDRASGAFVIGCSGFFPGFPVPGNYNVVARVNGSGAASILTYPPAGGWGMMGDVAINNAMDGYGAPSDGQNHHWFENFPNPDGQPLLGNLGFGLTMRSAPGTAAFSLLGLSLDRAAIPFAGVTVLLDPASVVLLPVPTTSPSHYALPIPASPSLTGYVLTAQGLHLESTLAVAASRGLEITIQ